MSRSKERRLVLAGLLLAFAACLASPAGAGEVPAGPEPGTGSPQEPAPAPPAPSPAAPAPPAPSPAPPPRIAEPAPPPSRTAIVTERKSAHWGVLLRGGYFGFPDAVADELFRQHPEVSGYIAGIELRYHGDGGARGVLSIGLALDYGTTEARGIWQIDEFDKPTAASGEITMTAATVTAYWNILPKLPLHPYVGFGLGVAYLEGNYITDDDLFEVSTAFPAVHIPAGIAVELGERFWLSAEARFINGIAAGGTLQVRF